MTLKNILYLSTIALALAACSSEDTALQQNSDAAESDQAITFDTYANQSTTRGEIDVTDDLHEKGFYVFANVISAGTSTPLMTDQHVTYATTATWVYSPVKYWPTSSSATVNFYAVYNRDKNTTVGYDWYGLPRVTFKVNEEVNKQTDFLWAKPLLGKTREDYISSPVLFTFEHGLTAYSFLFKTAGDYSKTIKKLKINSITLTGYFAQKGRIDPTATDKSKIWILEGDYNKLSYTISTENGGIDPDLTFPVNGTVQDVLKDDGKTPGYTTRQTGTEHASDFVANRDYIMLLPYKNVDSYTLDMSYTVYTEDETGTLIPQTYNVSKEFTINVSSDANLAGYHVESTIVLTLDQIEISAEVKDWYKKENNIDIPY